ncbi:hypothetical protein HRI_004473700 [Hibiscus trionum]|uniref:Uncharacterized protein n=1 Tax=Hibiscus trionum TaxID=183268 RepID=A0A9W7J4Q0_HIBTR|nr:hypothetical protein HRI_004473700 [Hibiscus trionum]
MKMKTCDTRTYDDTMTAHPKYSSFLSKKMDNYDEMAVVVGQDMATWSFAKTFADIELDDEDCSMPFNFETKNVEGERTKVSSFDTSKRKIKILKKVSRMIIFSLWVKNLVR